MKPLAAQLAQSPSEHSRRSECSERIAQQVVQRSLHLGQADPFDPLEIGSRSVDRLAMGREEQDEAGVVAQQPSLAASAVERAGNVDRPVENGDQR